MQTTYLIRLISILALSIASVGFAQEGAIVDRAEFFSTAAEEKALVTIEELSRKHEIEVRVETFATVPADQAARVEKMNARERGEFFGRWLKEVARERKAEGVLVLACREPSHLRVGLSEEIQRRGYTNAHRDAMTQRFLAAFKAEEFDRGLTSSLEYLHDTAERGVKAVPAASNTGARATAPRSAAPVDSGYGWMGWLCVGVAAVVVIGLVMSVVSAMFQRGSGGGMQGGGGYGGGGMGGGMMGGLLTGLGGALLGNWIYDQWSGGNSAQAGETNQDFGGDTSGGGAGSGFDDFGSSGGDFGGGDFGDGGGGDF